MMVSRAKKCPAQSAAGDVGEISFDRICLCDVDLVKIFASESKCVSLKEVSIQRHRAIFAQSINRRFRFGRQPDVVAFWFFQEQTRQSKNGICNRSRLELRDHIIERPGVRQKTNRNVWRSDCPKNLAPISMMSTGSLAVASVFGLARHF